MATYQELRTRSQQVRDEQNIGGNTALRVGQLLMDIVKYFNDNDEAASEYLQQHFAMVNDGTQLLNWQQSPIVILHTMGETYDEGDFSALSQGENYYRAGFIMEANGQGGGIKGETPKVNVLYVNLANDTLYTWNGASFDAITSGGGGGSISGDDIIKNAYYSNGNLVLIIETEGGDKTVTIPVNFDASNYVPTSRTVNGKQLSSNIVIGMADIPGLLQAIANAGSGAVSVTTNQDGTFVIHVGETDYTINLNHTHEGMAKLVKCTEATLPQTMADDTIYVQVDNLTTPTVIEALHIFGLEFTGGGGGSTPSLPYDAEIEYLQTTGTQYIDTGIVSGTNIVAEIKAILTQTSSDVQTFLCAMTGNNKSYSNLLSIKDVSTPYIQMGLGNSNVDSSTDPTVLHTYRTGLRNNSLFFETDGTTEGTRTISGTTSDLSLYLLSRHTDSGVDRGIYSKLYYCKITKDGSLVRDFIPVRKGTTGYLYDKVSGQLFGNSGSGSFTLGNDKS